MSLPYKFDDETLLPRALLWIDGTATESQRLEFLGDAILGKAVARMLFNVRPPLTEGQMTLTRSSVVRKDSLVLIAHDWQIAPQIRYQKNGFWIAPDDSVLADSVEAIIGAISLDGSKGAGAVEAIAAGATAALLNSGRVHARRDAKTRLQERLHAMGKLPPRYSMDGKNARCWVGSHYSTGTGATKRDAEQDAARRMLILVQRA